MGNGFETWVHKNKDWFPIASRIDPAVPDGLTRCVLPGLSSLELSRRDFATGTKLVAVGAPVAGPAYLLGTGNTHFLKGGFKETAEFTCCMTMKRDDTAATNDHKGVGFGSYRGSQDPGTIGYWDDDDTFRFQAYQAGNVAKIALLNIGAPTVLQRYTFICTALAVTAINESAEGAPATAAFTAARLISENPINILSSLSVNFLGQQGCFSFNWWPRALTAPERVAHWGQVLAHAAKRSVVLN